VYSCNFIRLIYLQLTRNMVLLLLSSHTHTSIAYGISLTDTAFVTIAAAEMTKPELAIAHEPEPCRSLRWSLRQSLRQNHQLKLAPKQLMQPLLLQCRELRQIADAYAVQLPTLHTSTCILRCSFLCRYI
jgi:hypothetical protein